MGTLSLYVGYEYDFHDGCQEFLKRVASLISAFIGRAKEAEIIVSTVQALRDDRQPIDVSQLSEAQLREQFQAFQQRQDTARQTLEATFGNSPDANVEPDAGNDPLLNLFEVD